MCVAEDFQSVIEEEGEQIMNNENKNRRTGNR